MTPKHTAHLLLERFGDEAQIRKSIEELAELTVQLAKHLNGADNTNEIVDEMADVQIMLWQLVEIFTCTAQLDFRIESKCQRSRERYGL
jgi:hypothetical protein